MKVCIRQEGDSWLAVFETYECYSPVDGHEVCNHDYVCDHTTPYTGDPEPVLRELARVGYRDLQVMKRLWRRA